jgi:hypothetical protein
MPLYPSPKSVRLAFLGLFAIACLTGCPNPNLYGTTKTVAPGRVQHTVAIEAIGATSGTASGTLPTLPTYEARIGLAERVDLGLRVANITSLQLNSRIRFLDGTVSMATQPSLTGTRVSAGDATATIGYLDVPLIVALKASESLTLVASPGAGVAFSTADVSGDHKYAAQGNAGYARFGVGLNVRVSEGFALHPEVTAMKFADSSAVLFTPGLGLQFGSIP